MEIEVGEIWKDIVGYENYQISNYGRVKSKERYTNVGIKNSKMALRKERILKPTIVSGGYLQVKLFKDTKYKNCHIHRLVAQAFIPNPNSLPCINHKDENRTNNSVGNLEWCTYSYNNNYGNRVKKFREKMCGRKRTKINIKE